MYLSVFKLRVVQFFSLWLKDKSDHRYSIIAGISSVVIFSLPEFYYEIFKHSKVKLFYSEQLSAVYFPLRFYH